jgi:hypothetical protein
MESKSSEYENQKKSALVKTDGENEQHAPGDRQDRKNRENEESEDEDESEELSAKRSRKISDTPEEEENDAEQKDESEDLDQDENTKDVLDQPEGKKNRSSHL